MKPDGRKASSTLPADTETRVLPASSRTDVHILLPCRIPNRKAGRKARASPPPGLAGTLPAPTHTFDKTGEKPHAALKRQSEPGLTSRALRLRREGHSFFLCCQNVAGACSAGPNAFPRHDVFLPFSCPCSQRISFFRHPQNFSAAFCKKRKQS